MNDLNVTIIKGNLVHDPELHTSNSGTSYTSFAIANNRRRKSGADWVEEVIYFDCTAFGKTAENLTRYKKKGDPLIVEGTLHQHRWSDAASGQKRQRVTILVDTIHWLPRKSDADARGRGDAEQVPDAVREAFPHAVTERPPVGEEEIPF